MMDSTLLCCRVRKKKPSKKKSERLSRSKDEGDVGPLERERSFLEERFSLLSTKKEKQEGPKARDSLSNEVAPKIKPVADNFRLNLIRKYRETPKSTTVRTSFGRFFNIIQ